MDVDFGEDTNDDVDNFAGSIKTIKRLIAANIEGLILTTEFCLLVSKLL